MADSGSNHDLRSDSEASEPEGITASEQNEHSPAVDEPTEAFSITSRPAETLEASGNCLPFQQLGKYAIQEQLGRGGMGVVWKAFDPDLHRAVAIKVLGEHLVHSATARRRFQREARAAAAINHANVLTIHSVEDQDGIPFLVMEYVHGNSLKEYVEEKEHLSPIEVIRLGSQIAQGLAAAHAQGVIHRDVKPGNVMLHEGATCARLTDFGLARAAFDNLELTSHDQCVGTATYMSPESLRGQRVDARSDLFSLGCVLHMMLIGYPPFQGRSQGEIIHKIIDSEPRRLHDLNPAIPPVLSDIVEKLLRKNPDDRFQSAAEVADVLSRLQHQLNQVPTDEIANLLATAPSIEDRSKSGRTGIMWLGLTVACVLCAILAWRLWPEGSTQSERDSTRALSNPARGASAGDSKGARTPEVKTSAGGAADGTKKLTSISVGPGSDADFSTIAEAILNADAGATITVAGPGHTPILSRSKGPVSRDCASSPIRVQFGALRRLKNTAV